MSPLRSLVAAALAGTGLAAGAFWQHHHVEQAGRQGAGILRIAQQEAGTQSYVAEAQTFALYNGRRIRATASVLASPQGARIVYHGDLEGVVYCQDKRRTWRMDPKDHCVYTTALGSGPTSPAALNTLLANYRVMPEGSASVAGRPTWVLSLQPRHSGDPAKRLWLDEARGVPLRSVDYDGAGHLIAETVYRSIRFGVTIPPQVFQQPTNATLHTEQESLGPLRPISIPDAQRTLGYPVLLPSSQDIPPGYRRGATYLVRCPCCRTPAVATRFDNGVASMMLFQCGSACATCLKETVRKLVDFSMGQAAMVRRGRYHYCLVGHLSPAQMERMIDAIPSR